VTKTLIAVFGLSVFGLAACTDAPSSTAQRSNSGALVPLTGSADCDDVDVEDTSSLVPDDWDDWCDGYLFGVDYIDQDDSVCDGFWEIDDEDIVDVFMSPGGGSHSYDYSVGMVDAMWTEC
jgi:hypothetical protein